MKKILTLTLLLFSFAVTASAQTVTSLYRLGWDQPAVDTGGTFTWEAALEVATAPFAPVLSVTCTGTPLAACSGALPQSLSTGRHTLFLRTVRTLDGVRYISAAPHPSITFDYLADTVPPSPQNLRPILPPSTVTVAVLGTVLNRGGAFGLDVATNALDGLPNFPFYFGASSLSTGGAYGSVQQGDRFYFQLWRP